MTGRTREWCLLGAKPGFRGSSAGRLDGVRSSLSGRQGRGFLPDTSPGVPAPGAPTSREASAQAAAADSARAGSPAPTPAAVREGARAADTLVPEVSGALFATDDLRGAVASFLTDGPGKATYSGR